MNKIILEMKNENSLGVSSSSSSSSSTSSSSCSISTCSSLISGGLGFD